MDKYEKIKLDNQLCFSLYAASREVIKTYKPQLDKYGLTYTQYIAMLVVWEYEKITVKEMGQKLHLDSGTLTPVLKKLLSMELIDKYRDKDDDRVVIVEVTEKGRKMKEEIIEVPEKMYCKFGKNIEDVVELKRLLDNLTFPALLIYSFLIVKSTHSPNLGNISSTSIAKSLICSSIAWQLSFNPLSMIVWTVE